MITKVISGGQIGAEQAALDVAIKLGISHGGWIQKGRRTESWTLPEKYQLKEMSTASYKERIEKNVIDSDGTLILSHGELTGASSYCRKVAEKHDRPCLHIDLRDTPVNVSVFRANAWVLKNSIDVLNVTGPRASEDPEIYIATLEILEGVVHLSNSKNKPRALDPKFAESLLAKQSVVQTYPKTVDEAVDKLISELPLKERVIIAQMTEEEVNSMNYTLGNYIIGAYGLQAGNKDLMASCSTFSTKAMPDEDDASVIIIKELWKKLRRTHKLRVVR